MKLNNYCAIGRLTKEIEIRTSVETKITSFNLAINRDKDVADFIPCVAFNKQAETLSLYCDKGSLIGIEGKLQTRNYEDKTGQKRFVVEVVVHRVDLLDKKKTEQEIPQPKKVELIDDDLEDSLPF